MHTEAHTDIPNNGLHGLSRSESISLGEATAKIEDARDALPADDVPTLGASVGTHVALVTGTDLLDGVDIDTFTKELEVGLSRLNIDPSLAMFRWTNKGDVAPFADEWAAQRAQNEDELIPATQPPIARPPTPYDDDDIEWRDTFERERKRVCKWADIVVVLRKDDYVTMWEKPATRYNAELQVLDGDVNGAVILDNPNLTYDTACAGSYLDIKREQLGDDPRWAPRGESDPVGSNEVEGSATRTSPNRSDAERTDAFTVAELQHTENEYGEEVPTKIEYRGVRDVDQALQSPEFSGRASTRRPVMDPEQNTDRLDMNRPPKQ
jgi:hypothetical protein